MTAARLAVVLAVSLAGFAVGAAAVFTPGRRPEVVSTRKGKV